MLNIESRGVAPGGGGEILLSVPILQDSLKVSSCWSMVLLYFS